MEVITPKTPHHSNVPNREHVFSNLLLQQEIELFEIADMEVGIEVGVDPGAVHGHVVGIEDGLGGNRQTAG